MCSSFYVIASINLPLPDLRNDHQDHNGTEYTEVRRGPHRLILGSLIGATEEKRRICDDQLYLEALSR